MNDHLLSQPAQLLILGASVRAAAQSALRAGIRPAAIDLFCDEDLFACCSALRCEDYPTGLPALAAQMPESPWMYTGALENYPDVIDRIAAVRPLLGNSGDAVRRVRDPLLWTQTLRSAGLPVLRVHRSPTNLATDVQWLQKPLKSASGGRIRFWAGEEQNAGSDAQETTEDARWYYQEWKDGIPCAAIFIGYRNLSQLIGVTRQLIGSEGAGASGFHYAGTIGPLRMAGNVQHQLTTIGEALRREFGLVGIFGVDAILSGDTVWPVEINPRYTASVEVLERASEMATLNLHVDACRDQRSPVVGFDRNVTNIVGKAVLYARGDVKISQTFSKFVAQRNYNAALPTIADIPAVGSEIPSGRPVVTVFAEATDDVTCESRLRQTVSSVEQILYASGS